SCIRTPLRGRARSRPRRAPGRSIRASCGGSIHPTSSSSGCGVSCSRTASRRPRRIGGTRRFALLELRAAVKSGRCLGARCLRSVVNSCEPNEQLSPSETTVTDVLFHELQPRLALLLLRRRGEGQDLFMLVRHVLHERRLRLCRAHVVFL